ncbi:hypothetical protein [Streptomyces sp. NPDC048481]|uniref:hypothetical protein n=1 Tax=Streptomyces sp. NPDC048481 TaxID=3365557 RepID=UPI003718FF02
MLWVAVLLLPLVSVLLVFMDRVEERLLTPVAAKRRHAGRRRHLRLIPGGATDTKAVRAEDAVKGAAAVEEVRAA